MRISVFAIEAERIAARLRTIDRGLRERVRAEADDASRCALLVDGRCVVYEERPLICRSHGVPTRFDGQTQCCALNFVDSDPPPVSVLQLHAVNEPLAVMATMHDGVGGRVALADLAKG